MSTESSALLVEDTLSGAVIDRLAGLGSTMGKDGDIMPWSNESGSGGRGPWGSPPGGGGNNGGGNNPWGNRPGGGPRRSGGSGGPGGQPPDIDDLIRKGQDRLRSMFPRGFGGAGLIGLVLVLGAIWLFSGVYRLQEGEEGVELLFGRYVSTETAGLRFNPPPPIGQVYRVNVANVNRIAVGYREGGSNRGGQTRVDVPTESLMVTRDENIVDIDFVVNWVISDSFAFLFNMRNPEETAKIAAESVMREIVGRNQLDFVITGGRTAIQDEARALLQSLLTEYGTGIQVTNLEIASADPPAGEVRMPDGEVVGVLDSFRAVVAARNDRETRINQANRYMSEIIPEARGDAERLIREAEAYKAQQIEKARGEASRFTSILTAYRDAEDVTTRRLYLETLEQVFRNSQKVIMDGGEGGTGVVPYLPLDQLRNNRTN